MFLSFCLLLPDKVIAGPPLGCYVPNCPENCGGGLTDSENPVIFSRTYIKQTKSVNKHRRVIRNTRSSNAPFISKALFEDHLALGKNRIYQVIPLGNFISMNVGAFDQDGVEAQVWNMPDFTQYPIIDTWKMEHITPESTGFADAFPEATHCFFDEAANAYQMMEITDDDLFHLASIRMEDEGDPFVLDLLLTASPLPLELGLEFEGTVIIEYTDDIDYDSTIFKQKVIVNGFGTLNTYDEGPVDALKMYYTQTNVDYKDGLVADSSFVQEIVWYSVKGHYLRGSLVKDQPISGETIFAHMEYQRLDNIVSTKDRNALSKRLNYFPNPVSAGDVLTITNNENLPFGMVRLYDMQGRVVKQLDLSGMGGLPSFQVQLPHDLVAGLYTFQVYTPQGMPLGHGKLEVQ